LCSLSKQRPPLVSTSASLARTFFGRTMNFSGTSSDKRPAQQQHFENCSASIIAICGGRRLRQYLLFIFSNCTVCQLQNGRVFPPSISSPPFHHLRQELTEIPQDRLREHAESFDGLLSLIPAKHYYAEDTSVSLDIFFTTRGQRG